MRDPREHHAACGCVHRCGEVEALHVTCRVSVEYALGDLCKSGGVGGVGVAFGVNVMEMLKKAFGEGCVSGAERRAGSLCVLKQVDPWRCCVYAAAANGLGVKQARACSNYR